MPRPNRYHPYAGRHQTAQPNPSPRYPPTPQHHYSHPLPAVAEHAHNRPFQPISYKYIRGITADGKTLLTKSILQAPDGTFYIEMQPVRFPSEDCTDPNTRQAQQTPAPRDFRMDSPQFDFDAIMDMNDNGPSHESHTPARPTVERAQVPSSDDSQTSVDDEECAIISEYEGDDEDAMGEDDNMDEHYHAIMQQTQIILGLIEDRTCTAELDRTFRFPMPPLHEDEALG